MILFKSFIDSLDEVEEDPEEFLEEDFCFSFFFEVPAT